MSIAWFKRWQSWTPTLSFRWVLLLPLVVLAVVAVLLVGGLFANFGMTLFFCLGTLTIAIALGLFIDELLLRRLEQLLQSSQQLAAGQLDQRLPCNHPIPEFNRLAGAFNRLADQLQASLQQSESRYRSLMQAIPDLFIQLDQQGTYLQVFNPGNIPLFNPASMQPGKSIFDVLPSDLAERRIQMIQTALRTRQSQSYEYEIVVNGTTRYEEARITPCEDETVLVIVRDMTDRKRSEIERQAAERALQQSEVRYRAIVEDQTELICRARPDMTILFVNDAYCRYFGVSPEALTGTSFLPFIHAQDQAEVTRLLSSLSPAQTTITCENRVMVQGGVRWMQWIARALLDEQGEFTELQAVGRDITDLKQVEAALTVSNERYRELAETVQEGFFVFETTTAQYSYLNPAFIRISGTPITPFTIDGDYSKGMLHWLNNIHPGDRDRIEQALQAERQGRNFDEEYRFIRPNGELRWLRSKAFPIQDETGKVIRIVGTVEDITDRKQLELALQDSEERFRKAFDGAPIGMSLVTPGGQFLKANARYCNLVGYTEAELVTMTFHAITHPDDLAADLSGMEQIFAGQLNVLQLQKRYITKQGTVIPALMQTAPIRDQQGQILYFVGHIQDIRDRLQVERMKDEFVSIVSHELRTPLTSIRGSLGILESGVFNNRPEKATHMLKIALDNSDRLVRLVNDILDLERLKSGKIPLAMQDCQVADLLQQAINSVQAIADQASVALSLDSLSTRIWADPDAIIQTLTNLLSNAIKFSNPGEKVWLKAEQLDTTPGSPNPILFSVRDRGRGIPPDKLDLIFEQFQQVDVSDSRRKGGTGLGLAICKNIVQQHGY